MDDAQSAWPLPQSMFQDVADFHEKFGLGFDSCKPMSGPEWELRHQRLKEEYLEYEDSETDEDRLDALVDLCYIAMGTAHRAGWNFEEAWARVHAANMAKERGTARTSKYGSRFDIVKPEGWKPPNLSDLV